jgi:hypothetical protein
MEVNMKQPLKRAAMTVALAALIIASSSGFAAQSNPPAKAFAGSGQSGAAGHANEKHPAMRKALRQLEATKQVLQNDASRDFDGHRAKAVQLIDQAIEQLKQGIQSDKH